MAPPDRVKYLIGWVERFLQSPKGGPLPGASDAASAFLHELSRQEEPWKVRQAREAIRRPLAAGQTTLS